MASQKLFQRSGLAAMVGGALYTGLITVMASRPPGLPGGVYRDTRDLEVWMVASLLALACGVVGLYASQTRYAGKMGKLALGFGLGGIALLSAGMGISILGGDYSAKPLFIIPGFLALIVGSLLSGSTILRVGLLPRWVGALLIIASCLLLFFNSEDTRALLAVPFGLAWFGIGYTLCSEAFLLNNSQKIA